MNNKCEIIQDLIPLYHDKIASKPTQELVKTHIQTCQNCKQTLQTLENITNKIEKENILQIQQPDSDRGEEIMKNISNQWEKDKKLSFLKGTTIISIIASLICIILFKMTPVQIMADGQLYEPFYLIPLGEGFAAIAIISVTAYLIIKRRKK